MWQAIKDFFVGAAGGAVAASGAPKATEVTVGVVNGAIVGAGGYPQSVNLPIAMGAAGAVKNELNAAAAGVAKIVWRALPWWVWVAGVVALFGYLGGFTWARRALVAKAVAS